MGAAMSSAWFFLSPIPDISSKGKPKPKSAASMLCSCICLMMMFYAGYRVWSETFPFPMPAPFYPGMLLVFCLSCCSSSKLVGQARKFAKV